MRLPPSGSGSTAQSSLNQCSHPCIRVVVDPDGVRYVLVVAHAVVATAVSASSTAERIDPAFVVMVLAFRCIALRPSRIGACGRLRGSATRVESRPER